MLHESYYSNHFSDRCPLYRRLGDNNHDAITIIPNMCQNNRFLSSQVIHESSLLYAHPTQSKCAESLWNRDMPYETIESGQLNKTAMGNGQINRYSTENRTDLPYARPWKLLNEILEREKKQTLVTTTDDIALFFFPSPSYFVQIATDRVEQSE